MGKHVKTYGEIQYYLYDGDKKERSVSKDQFLHTVHNPKAQYYGPNKKKKKSKRTTGVIIEKFSEFILERSSLTLLGVPREVMQNIQYNFEIDSDANWVKIPYKKDLKEELKNDEIAFFIEISVDYIKVILNINKEYFIQYFNYKDDGWGGEYQIKDLQETSLNQLMIGVDPKHLLYKLDGNFQHRPKVQRMVQREVKELEDETKSFKYYILKHFNNIIKRIYGKRYKRVMMQISKNLAKASEGNISIDEIYKFLEDNKKLAQIAKEYEIAKNDDDILRLNELEAKHNSLSVLENYLVNFEVLMSEKYGEHMNIKDIIKRDGRMKTETNFMYYLFTGKQYGKI